MSILAKWVGEFSLPRLGVIHVGAHEAQEASAYSVNSLEPVLWVEAIPSLASRAKVKLKNFPSQTVVEAALWSKSGIKKTFNISSNDGGSSSFFEFYLHSASYPEVSTTSIIEVQTQTLKEIFEESAANHSAFGYLVLDVQGAELEVLKGSLGVLDNLLGIVTEVSVRELYKNAPLLPDLTMWLNSNQFVLVACNISSQTGWGDALFMKSDYVNLNGLPILESDQVFLSNRLSFPTFVRIKMIKVGLNPKFFSKSFLLWWKK